MRHYRVNVNGTSYEISVEEITAEEAKKSAAAAPSVPATAPAPAPAPAAAPAPASEGATTVSSPMPGTILSVSVSAGSTVKKGDILMILEAMKMENEIMAPCDGRVASVGVQQGASVKTGDMLCVIE